MALSLKGTIRLVTDQGTRVCVDPGGNGVTMNVGGGGGPGPAGGRENEQLVPQQWRQIDIHRMLEDKEDGLDATSRLRHAQSMYHCMC